MHAIQNPGMPAMGIPTMMQQSSPQQQQMQMGPQPQNPAMAHPQQQQQQQAEKIDNISKVKSLIVPLRESLSVIKYQFTFIMK